MIRSMRSRITGRRAVATLCLMAAASAACADDTVDFLVRGAIVPACGLSASRVKIDLGTVTAAELTAGHSAWRGASFSGTDCVGVTRASVTVVAPPYGPDGRYIATTGGAGGVAIELQTASGQPLPPDGVTEARFHWPSGQPILAFQARYVRVATVKPGPAGAMAQVHIRWE